MNANKGDTNRDISGKYLIVNTRNSKYPKEKKKRYLDMKQNLEVGRQKATNYLIYYNEILMTEENWGSV